MNGPREAFLAAIRVLQPYMDDIVIVGGWVPLIYHYSYARPSSGGEPLGTADVDVVLPSELAPRARERIEETLASAGYESTLGRVVGEDEPCVTFEKILVDGTLSQVQFLTPQKSYQKRLIQIGGQEPLTAQALPHHNVLLENSIQLSLDSRFHPSLEQPLLMTVPEPAAFVYVKGLTWERRGSNAKKAKDLAYIVDLVARYPTVRAKVVRDLPTLSTRYADAWLRRFLTSLARAFAAPGGKWSRMVAQQLIGAGLREGTVPQIAQEVFVVAQDLLEDLKSKIKGKKKKKNGRTT